MDEFHALQVAHDEAMTRLSDALAHIKVLEGTLDVVRQDNNTLLRDRDWHYGRYVEMRTNMQNIATHFINALHDPAAPEKPEVAKVAENLEQEILGAPTETK